MEAAHGRHPSRPAHCASVSPWRCDRIEFGVDRKTDDVAAVEGFEQRKRRLAAIMAVGTNQDLDAGEVAADATYQMAQHVRDLRARGPFAGPQQRQDRLAREAVEDVDRLEAGAIVVSIEQCEFLL